MEQSPGIVAARQLGRKRKGRLMGHPACEFRLEATTDLRIDPDKCRTRSTAEPFQAAANVDVDSQPPDVDGDGADGLVAVDDGDGLYFASLGGNCRNVVHVSRFE